MSEVVQVDMLVRRICLALPRYAYRFANERDLQDGIAAVLVVEGIRFSREYVASKEDRFDFLCESGIVIEAKIDGGFADCARQIQRYCNLDVTQAVIIATSKMWGRSIRDGVEIAGKPVRLVRIRRQSL